MIQQFSVFSTNSDIRHWHIPPACCSVRPPQLRSAGRAGSHNWSGLKKNTKTQKEQKSTSLNLNRFHDSAPCVAAHTVCQHNSRWDHASQARNTVHWGHSITTIKYCFMVKCVTYTVLFIQQTQFWILQCYCESIDKQHGINLQGMPSKVRADMMLQMHAGSCAECLRNANLPLNQSLDACIFKLNMNTSLMHSENTHFVSA